MNAPAIPVPPRELLRLRELGWDLVRVERPDGETAQPNAELAKCSHCGYRLTGDLQCVNWDDERVGGSDPDGTARCGECVHCLAATPVEDPPGGVEALRAQLAEALWRASRPSSDSWEDASDKARRMFEGRAGELVPLVVRYAKDQRRAGAEEALGEAVAFCRSMESAALERRGDYSDGLANAYDAVADELSDRADGARGRQQ